MDAIVTRNRHTPGGGVIGAGQNYRRQTTPGEDLLVRIVRIGNHHLDLLKILDLIGWNRDWNMTSLFLMTSRKPDDIPAP
ncbi:MAG: hypothetical protein WAN04_01025 [Candidatus Udaeobacter sp.]